MEEQLQSIYTNNKYTIIATFHTCGSITVTLEKEHVRKECERLKKLYDLGSEGCYARIEVVNNQTGEIREFWNSSDKKELF